MFGVMKPIICIFKVRDCLEHIAYATTNLQNWCLKIYYLTWEIPILKIYKQCKVHTSWQWGIRSHDFPIYIHSIWIQEAPLIAAVTLNINNCWRTGEKQITGDCWSMPRLSAERFLPVCLFVFLLTIPNLFKIIILSFCESLNCFRINYIMLQFTPVISSSVGEITPFHFRTESFPRNFQSTVYGYLVIL